MSRYGSDPRDGHRPPDGAKRDEQRGGLLSRHNQQNQQNGRTPPSPDSRPNSRGRDSQRRPERAPANLPRYGAGNAGGNGGSTRSLRDDAPAPAPRQPAPSASRGRGKPSYEPYADAPWNQSWQWSDNPQTTESQTYPAADGQGGWDASQEWRAGQWDESAQWGASEAWQPAAQLNSQLNAQQGALGGRGAGATKGNGDDGSGQQKKSWKRRLGLTRDAWQWETLRAWPGVLRLVMAVMFAGGLIGLLTFTIRPIPVGGTLTANGSPLQGPGNGPVPTAPPSLYGQGGPQQFVPPTNTPVPTHTPVTLPTMSAQPLTIATNCAQSTSASSTLTDNSANPVSYSIAITDANGAPTSLVTASGTPNPVPAHGTAQVTFDASTGACLLAKAHTYTATITWNAQPNAAGTPPAGAATGTLTVTDTVTPAPTTPPTKTPTPTPTCTPIAGGGPCI